MGQDPKMLINNRVTFVSEKTWAYGSEQTWVNEQNEYDLGVWPASWIPLLPVSYLASRHSFIFTCSTMTASLVGSSSPTEESKTPSSSASVPRSVYVVDPSFVNSMFNHQQTLDRKVRSKRLANT